MKRLLAVLCILLLTASTTAASITVGTATGANLFPFTGDGFNVNNRYQQVYAAANFSGPVTISGITFFNTVLPGAVFETADYSFSFSTSNFTVDNLDTVDLNANPGGDAQAFNTVNLSGLTGSSFTILGSFNYDPSGGDLLVDITRTNQVVGSGSGFLDAMNGDAGGVFSRAHNYNGGFEGFGLVTRFETASAGVVPEPMTLVVWSALIGSAVVVAGRRGVLNLKGNMPDHSS